MSLFNVNFYEEIFKNAFTDHWYFSHILGEQANVILTVAPTNWTPDVYGTRITLREQQKNYVPWVSSTDSI
ncbi:unnamed protein product [Acanthoscelides obtectus]|uniref:Uncharacterized protein n=1 Tax=Acanthoscelides obtectus TaxID=200917 RepID=A0A9P0NW71_ACAOB|nr:unnamed protein product [Acanthoscelides obtectus]CAK1665994.1 hypothetical protein AOBTE_LOCUS25103 [Acanthoscelides obtectus]